MFKTSLFLLSFASCIFFACSSSKKNLTSEQPNTLTQKEEKGGWVLLFDGKTMDGWYAYNKNAVTKNWKVAVGALVMDPTLKDKENYGDLITDKTYKNSRVSVSKKSKPADGADQRKSIKSICIIQRNL